MAHWNSRGLRGSSFEEIINFTNERYRQSGLALFQKIPTPITPVRMDEETRTITLAYFEKQSTVDYIGVAQGIPIAFDAKETAGKKPAFAEYPCTSDGFYGGISPPAGTFLSSRAFFCGRCILSFAV